MTTSATIGLPRMRGDPPSFAAWRHVTPLSTPHARGSTRRACKDPTCMAVYPACAGIHLIIKYCLALADCLPRMRGDPPTRQDSALDYHESTPHARGSTIVRATFLILWNVYPACAGIHPKQQTGHQPLKSLPRMRGDPPRAWRIDGSGRWSTPHARGSTSGG